MIIDDTLREGLQSPNVAFKFEEKIHLAKLISDAGIERAIVSHPSAHRSEFEATKVIVDKKVFKETFALGRIKKEDIDLIDNTGANISLYLPFKIEDIDKILDLIRYAKSKNKLLDVAIVNISNLQEEELIKLAKKLNGIGVDSIQLADSLGEINPKKSYEIVKKVKQSVESKISVHFHNDYGLSVVNSVSAIYAGADFVGCTLMGIGERNGIADLATIAHFLINSSYKLNIDFSKLKKAYDYLIELLKRKGWNFYDNIPIFGENTQIHTAGTHAYFSNVFKNKNYSINVYTGKTMIKEILEKNNIAIEEKKLEYFVNKIKDHSVEIGKAFNEKEVIELYKEWLE